METSISASDEQPRVVNILLVEDHPVVRLGLKAVLDMSERFQITQETGSAPHALALIHEESPDLAIIDIVLDKSDGLELIKDIRARDHEFPILVVSMHEERLYAERVLKAGGNGYMMKRELAENLVPALERISDGHIYVSDNMKELFLEKAAGIKHTQKGLASLSDRELQVFRLLGQGITTREIAQQLCLSVKTIETHRSHIKEKLGLKNAAELVSTATRWLEYNG